MDAWDVLAPSSELPVLTEKAVNAPPVETFPVKAILYFWYILAFMRAPRNGVALPRTAPFARIAQLG